MKVRGDTAAVRVAVAVAIGVVAALAAGFGLGWVYAASVGWDAAAVVFLAWTWAAILDMDAQATAAHAAREDPSKHATQVIMLTASVASLFGVGFLLVHASTATGSTQGLIAGLGVGSVAVSWGVVHSLFTLRYALIFYTPDATGKPAGGAEFHQDADPRYIDFAYLAFTVGMTFQVSDTDISTVTMRQAVLRHALLSYLFGALILAATINLIATLASTSH